MNETEKKMLDYLQSILDDAKEYRLSDDYETGGIAQDIVAGCMGRFGVCASMFKAVTGKEVTFRAWKVIVEE